MPLEDGARSWPLPASPNGAAPAPMLGWPARQVLALLLVCAAEPASPNGGEAAADHFPPGSRVELHGLRTTGASLNGQNGTVRAFDADARRYSVRLDGAFWAKRIKPDNLKPARPAPAGASGSLPRPWWVVYDAVAASLAALAVWLGMQLCWQFSVPPRQGGEPSAERARHAQLRARDHPRPVPSLHR